MEKGIHIALKAEQVGQFFGVPITNTLVTSWGVLLVLLVLALVVGRKVDLIPNRVQTLFETLFEFVYNYIAETLESRELARRFFPLLMTIFLFILTSNLLEFTPGIGSIGFFKGAEFTPLFRSVNTDLNVTLALAAIAFAVIEITGFTILGAAKYAQKFFNVHSVMGFFVGIIDLVSELARLISFSFRLFGNIIAGEVLIVVVIYFAPYIAPVPLMMFEIFVGLIQATIFAVLTLFFIKIAITEAH